MATSNQVKQNIFLPKLKVRHLAGALLGLPMMAISVVNQDPVLAGSLFIALSVMMFDQQLSRSIICFRNRIKTWQVIVAISVTAALFAGLVNPVNAISAEEMQLLKYQLTVPATTVTTIKLAIVTANLLLMAVIFFLARFVKHVFLRAKKQK